MSNLQEIRDEWEKGGEQVLCVVHNTDGYEVVFVVMKFKSGYDLMRYFVISDQWFVSSDITNGTLEECLAEVTTQFENIIP